MREAIGIRRAPGARRVEVFLRNPERFLILILPQLSGGHRVFRRPSATTLRELEFGVKISMRFFIICVVFFFMFFAFKMEVKMMQN